MLADPPLWQKPTKVCVGFAPNPLSYPATKSKSFLGFSLRVNWAKALVSRSLVITPIFNPRRRRVAKYALRGVTGQGKVVYLFVQKRFERANRPMRRAETRCSATSWVVPAITTLLDFIFWLFRSNSMESANLCRSVASPFDSFSRITLHQVSQVSEYRKSVPSLSNKSPFISISGVPLFEKPYVQCNVSPPAMQIAPLVI